LSTGLEAHDTGLGAIGGIRTALRSQSVSSRVDQPSRPKVRVIANTGVRREGYLVSLTDSEVVLEQQGQSLTIPLGEVRRVEKATHRVRNGLAWGAIGGYVIGYVASCGGGDEGHCWPEMGAMVAGIGAAAGAATGLFQNRSKRTQDSIYERPGTAASLTVAPLLSPRRTGVALSVGW
jgi:hypothetical protein